MTSDQYVLGYDIGGTKIGIGVASTDGKLLAKCRIENKDTHPDDILPQLVTEGKRLIGDAGLKMSDIAAFGISAPFPANAFEGVMIAPSNNPKWRNVPIKKYLSDHLQMDGHFENDATSAALAEWFFGAGRGYTDFIYLTMSTGIGGGIIAAGKLVRGALANAGEIGHIVIEANGPLCNCGLHGCYEAFAGGRAVADRLQRELKDNLDHPIVKFAGGKLEDVDMIALEKAVRANDSYALKIWDEMSMRNAQGFGTLINIFNPQRLILGTLAWAVGDLYTDPIKHYLPQFAWADNIAVCELVDSQLRRDIGYYAGAAAAINYLNEKKLGATK